MYVKPEEGQYDRNMYVLMRVIKFVVCDGSMCVKFHRKFV